MYDVCKPNVLQYEYLGGGNNNNNNNNNQPYTMRYYSIDP